MAGICQGQSIFNFGFVSCTLDRPYLEHASRLLRSAGRNPALVIGVTPFSLMRRSVRKNGYQHWSGQKGLGYEELTRQIRRQNLTGLSPLRSWARNALNLVHRRPLSWYHADGWEASYPLHRDAGDYVARMRRVYTRRQVDQELCDEFLQTVRELARKGIAFFAFRTPCEAEVGKVEDEMSGLDWGDFSGRFQDAGGRWLPVAETVPTYDGIHMDAKAAVRFSRHLAGLLRPGMPLP